MDIQKSVVAILNRRKIIGSGFLAGDGLILTCAHVIETVGAGLDDQVTVRFAADRSEAAALVVQYSSSYEGSDVALLRVDSVPEGVVPLPLGKTAGSAGHNFYAYGYATVTNVQGIGARGKIVDIVDSGRLVQLTSQEPDHGMSGGPVLDERRHVVIGMVTKGKGLLDKDQNLRNTQTTFAVSSDVLLSICPELKVTNVAKTAGTDALVEDAENVNVTAEVVGGDKVTHNVYNYYQTATEEKTKLDLKPAGNLFLRLSRSWVTWVALVVILAAAAGLIWYQQQPITVAACQSDGKDDVILVANFEVLGVAERDVSRFIIDDLEQRLKTGLSPTNFIVCQYPRVLKSDADALTAARVNRATVVVWGNYTPDFVEMEIQLGDIPGVLLAQDELAKATSVRIRFKNERESSIARQVMSVVDMVLLARGNIYGYMRGTVKTIQMPNSNVNIVSSGISAKVHQCITLFVTDTQKALDQVNQALEIDPSNSMLYILQAVALQRLGKFDESMDSVRSAMDGAPPQWTPPLVFKANRDLFTGNIPKAIVSFGQLIEAQPSDWYPYNMRGYLYLAEGDLDKAKADIDKSLTLQPQENWPYTWASAIALRQGRLADMQGYVAEASKKFPDADAGEKVVSIIAAENSFTPALSAFWSMVRGSLQKAIEKADLSIKITPTFTDAYYIKGISYCYLEKYAEAEAAYSQAIMLEPAFGLLYLLRADVRQKQGNLTGAISDIQIAQSSPQAEQLKPYIQAAMQNQLSCENILTATP